MLRLDFRHYNANQKHTQFKLLLIIYHLKTWTILVMEKLKH